MFNPMPITKQEKIDAIYEKIANKELTFWCKILLESPSDWRIEEDIVISDKYNSSSVRWRQYRLILKDYIKEIIGNPVMIGDVLDYINEDIYPGAGYDEVFYHSWESVVDTIKLWEEKRKPIEDQSDDCIDFIYDLICK